MNSDIEAEVIRIVAEQAMLEPGDVSPADTLEGLGVDSMALVECIFAIEERFDITVPFNANAPQETGLDNATVAQLAGEVARLVEASTGTS